MDEIENTAPLWGEIPKSPALVDPRPPASLFRNFFNHPSKDLEDKFKQDVGKGAEKGTRKRLKLRGRKARAIKENIEPLWGELLIAPALIDHASLFQHFFNRVSKHQEDELKQDMGKGAEKVMENRLICSSQLRDNKESRGTLAPPTKRQKRLPFQEIGDSALNAPTCPAGTSGSLPQDIDEIDLHYAKDLYVFYKHQQNVRRPVDYMANQPGINADIRAYLVGLLTVAHRELHLQPETLYLAVYIVDRFLSLHAVTRRQLHAIGFTSLLLATKYEEDWVPKVYKFLAFSGGYCTRQELCFWEKTILEKLEWYLTVPTVFMFLIRFVKAAKADEELEHMIYFYGELGLMDYSLILYRPSMVAASSVYAARCALSKSPPWTDALQQYTSYAESQLMDCARILVQAHLAAPDSKRKMDVVYKKYLDKQFGAVARYPPATNLIESKQSAHDASQARLC